MKKCFFICPLDNENTKTRERSDRVMEYILTPVADALGYELFRADLSRHEKVSESISKGIFESDIVIADLSDKNPNVFYELGKRHAWKGRCVHLINNISTIPFDLQDYRVYEYNFSSTKVKSLKNTIIDAIKTIEQTPVQTPFPLNPEDVISLSGSTVLVEIITDRKNHYYLAEKLALKKSKRIFLMQRSSSLILGPEYGWGAEKTFYKVLLEAIETGTEFYHIVSLDGIARHLDREYSTFPDIKMALGNLEKTGTGGCVAIKSHKKNSGLMYFKKISVTEEDKDFKPDRQARAFIIEDYEGNCEGVLVIDLGGVQSAFHLKGPKIGSYLNDCVSFYRKCDLLKWDEVNKVVENYLKEK